MYHDELAREAKLIARGYQEYAELLAERWQALLHWLGGAD